MGARRRLRLVFQYNYRPAMNMDETVGGQSTYFNSLLTPNGDTNVELT